MSPVEGWLISAGRLARTAALLAACALLAGGCGPEGPRDKGGASADPVELLTVLPTPNGLADDGGPVAPGPVDVLDALLGTRDTTQAQQMVDAGLERSGVRRWTATGGGGMAAVVTVWPSKAIAFNFSLQVSQQDLGDPGVTAWTPRDLPGAQGTRQEGGDRVRVLTRTVGPNALVVRATGSVPDNVVAKAMERLILVQESKN